MQVPEIITTLTDADLFFLFRRQLKKDLSHAGMEADFVDSLDPDYEAIYHTLSTAFERKMNAQMSFSGLLVNRVDISEKQMTTAMANASGPFHEVLADLVIKRILQKVIIKKRFSG
jgi:hypothetical protein